MGYYSTDGIFNKSDNIIFKNSLNYGVMNDASIGAK